jgi:hypothetical protein
MPVFVDDITLAARGQNATYKGPLETRGLQRRI